MLDTAKGKAVGAGISIISLPASTISLLTFRRKKNTELLLASYQVTIGKLGKPAASTKSNRILFIAIPHFYKESVTIHFTIYACLNPYKAKGNTGRQDSLESILEETLGGTRLNKGSPSSSITSLPAKNYVHAGCRWFKTTARPKNVGWSAVVCRRDSRSSRHSSA